MTRRVDQPVHRCFLGGGLALSLLAFSLPPGSTRAHLSMPARAEHLVESGSVLFEDQFEGVSIDPGKWNTSTATSGARWCPDSLDSQHSGPGVWLDVSTDPCHDLTQQPPYGSLSVADGEAAFGSEAGKAFPYIWTGPPSRQSPFPGKGDFTMQLRLRYDSLQTHGAGIAVLDWRNSEPVGDNPPAPAGQAVLSIWADAANGLHASVVGADFSIADSLASHAYSLEYFGGAYSLLVDGEVIAGPIVSELRPNTLWIGNPVFTFWADADWTDFAIDSVVVARYPPPAEAPTLGRLNALRPFAEKLGIGIADFIASIKQLGPHISDLVDFWKVYNLAQFADHFNEDDEFRVGLLDEAYDCPINASFRQVVDRTVEDFYGAGTTWNALAYEQKVQSHPDLLALGYDKFYQWVEVKIGGGSGFPSSHILTRFMKEWLAGGQCLY